MARILVVEDDNHFREAICDFLKRKQYDVFQAPNGKAAKEIISVQDLNIVLTDIQMPGLTGIELMEWALKHKPLPFIVMTGFSMLLETQSAYDLGAKEFITKPFKNADLLSAIERILGTTKEPEVVSQVATEYCKVSIDEFVARPTIEFDVYVKLSDQKYIKIAHKGETMPRDRVQQYKDKGLRYLYIAKEDFGKLVDFNLNLANIIKDRSDISDEKKMNFMKYTGEAILEKAFVEGVDRESFKEAQSFLGMTINVITDSKEHFDMLSLLNAHSDYIYAHSIGVAMHSIMIARKMGYESNQVFFKLSMAGMFHDIGKKEIDRQILEKARPLLSNSERALIESHATRSKEILLAIKGIPEDVVQIVYEHHEDCAGQGYPMAKKKHEMHPLSKILQTANLFMEQALKGPNHPGMSGLNAVAYLEKIYFDRLDPACVTALKSLFSA
ncbi:MAG: response regulator [Bdellovibrionales bacterium]